MSDMRAKMRVNSAEKQEGYEAETLIFSAVSRSEGYESDGKDENNTYALWTPTADLKMQVNNPTLHGKFKVGEEYYVDFTKA